MGCASSKHDCIKCTLPSASAGKEAWLLQYPSTDGASVTAAAIQYAAKGICQTGAQPSKASPAKNIQDLPPHILANIISRQDNWLDLFRSIPLVCKSWNQVLHHATPADISLELDTPSPTPTQHKPAGAALAGLQRFHSWRLQRRQRQRHQQQEQHFVAPSVDAYSEVVPWAAWLAQHNDQLQQFSVSINATGSSCNEQQYRLKELALQALAANHSKGSSSSSSSSDAAAAKPAESCHCGSCDSSSNSSNEGMDAKCDGIMHVSSIQAAVSGQSDSSSATSLVDMQCTVVDGSGSSSSSDVDSTGAGSGSSTGQLQLRSLELRLPLFEHDVQLISSSICSRAPQLQALALIGYTPTGSSSSSGSGSNRTVVTTQLQLPAPQQQQQQPAAPVMQLAGQQQQQQQQHGPQQQQQNAVQGADTSSSASSEDQKSPNHQIIRQGFITGTSLQQLMTAATNLRSLTFACRQLYKTNWLAPASKLTHLSLRNCQLTHHSLSELVALNLPELVSLDLSLNPDLGRVQQKHSSRSSRRTSSSDSSSSSSNSSNSKRCSSLASVAKLTQLTRLDISGWDLAEVSKAGSSSDSSTAGMNFAAEPPFAQLSSLKALADLRMDGCGIVNFTLSRDKSPDSQAGGMLLQLTSLSLSHNPLSSDSIVAVCSLTQLRQLGLAAVATRSTITAAAAASRTAQHAANLRTGMASSLWRASSVSRLGLNVDSCWTGMQGMPRLTELQLATNWFSERDVVVFTNCLCASISDMPQLSKVDLSGCKFPHKMLPELLRRLPPSVNDVTLDNCVHVTRSDLRALGVLPQLRRLSVANMQPGLRDKHAQVIAGLTGLRVLVVTGCEIGSKGLSVLRRQLPQLRELHAVT